MRYLSDTDSPGNLWESGPMKMVLRGLSSALAVGSKPAGTGQGGEGIDNLVTA